MNINIEVLNRNFSHEKKNPFANVSLVGKQKLSSRIIIDNPKIKKKWMKVIESKNKKSVTKENISEEFLLGEEIMTKSEINLDHNKDKNNQNKYNKSVLDLLIQCKEWQFSNILPYVIAYNFSLLLRSSQLEKSVQGKSKCLKWPERFPRTQKTLILDLDKTLIHRPRKEGELGRIEANTEYLISKKFTYIYTQRPYLELFLDDIYNEFEIVVYSSGEESYVNDIISSDPLLQDKIDHILTREYCTKAKGRMKDLDVITNRDKKDLIIIDDKIMNWGKDLDNLIPINEYKGNRKDFTLPKLLHLIHSAGSIYDVRDLLIPHFKIQSKYSQFVDFFANLIIYGC